MAKEKNKYLPNNISDKLAHVSEEAGEVIAAIGKTQRFGLDSYNPELPEKEREYNVHWIKRELKNLKAAIKRLERDQQFQYWSRELSQ